MTPEERAIYEYDLVIIGGGPGGMSAAMAAGDAGLKVAVIERNGFLAGTVNVGLCLHGFEDGHGNRVIGGRSWEIIQRCIDEGGSVGPTALSDAHMYSTTPVDMAILQKCALEMMEEAGVDLWFHTLMTKPVVKDGRIAAVRAWGNSGEFEFRAPTFIDATGNADLAFRAGVPTRIGRIADGKMQPMSLGITVTPVDIDAMMKRVGGGFGRARKPGTDREDYVWFAIRLKEWRKEVEDLGIHLGKEGTCWGNSLYPGIVNLNSVKVIGKDATDTLELSQAEAHSRKTAVRFVEFMRKKVPGFENARIVRISPFIGVRETRHVEGRYTLTPEDALEGRVPDDSIALCGYPVDIHDPIDGVAEFQPIGEGRFGVSFGSLVPIGMKNLLVSGRAISASDVAYGSVRVMGTCLAIGEACAHAVVIARKTNIDVCDVDGRTVRDSLERAGVMIA